MYTNYPSWQNIPMPSEKMKKFQFFKLFLLYPGDQKDCSVPIKLITKQQVFSKIDIVQLNFSDF